ncbi:MAG: hypothetical protein ACOYEV_10035 [Candidatus Nanopelagicales bacterium]
MNLLRRRLSGDRGTVAAEPDVAMGAGDLVRAPALGGGVAESNGVAAVREAVCVPPAGLVAPGEYGQFAPSLAGQEFTEVLAPPADDLTVVLGGAPAPPDAAAEEAPRGLSRATAAEIGIYIGAVLIGAAAAVMAWQGWQAWSYRQQLLAGAGAVLGLAALGFWLRLPLDRELSGPRRRAVSVTVCAGSLLALVALPDPAGALLAGALAVLANVLARSALAESQLLFSGAGILVLAGLPGLVVGLGLAAGGVLWAYGGLRWLRGKRTAVVAGSSAALLGLLTLAAGPAQLAGRLAIASLGVAALIAFARGAANYWLALGATALTALAATVAGDYLGPVVAIAAGGAATMVASAVALLSVREERGAGHLEE